MKARRSQEGSKRTGILLEKVFQPLQLVCMWNKNYQSCVVCGKVESAHESKGRCKKCYHAIYRSLNRDRMAASKKRWYKRNMTPENQKFRRESRHFGLNRELALSRDGHRCQVCGCADLKKLTVHHKDENGRPSDAPNNTLDNLQTLCRACHINVHRSKLWLGRKGLLVLPKRDRKPPFKQKPIATWSRLNDACVICHKTDSKHVGRGWCTRCIQRKDIKHLYKQSPRYSLSFKET